MKWKRERKRIYEQIKNTCLPIISTLLPPNTLVCKYLIITSKCKCSSISTTTLWCPIILTIAFFLWFAVHAHGRILFPPPPKNATLLGFFICNFPNLLIAPFFPLSSFPLSSLEADEVISQLVTVWSDMIRLLILAPMSQCTRGSVMPHHPTSRPGYRAAFRNHRPVLTGHWQPVPPADRL